MCHLIFFSSRSVVCACLCAFVHGLRALSRRASSFRFAQSAPSQRLHRVSVRSATSGCVTSAQICTSTRVSTPLPSVQIRTSSRGPVPPSVLTCTREAPAPCLLQDKARYLCIYQDYVSSRFSGCVTNHCWLHYLSFESPFCFLLSVLAVCYH